MTITLKVREFPNYKPLPFCECWLILIDGAARSQLGHATALSLKRGQELVAWAGEKGIPVEVESNEPWTGAVGEPKPGELF